MVRMWFLHCPPEVTMLQVFTLVYFYTAAQAYVINAVVDMDEKAITCWTCPNKTDNEACNNWAPDRECQTNHTVCQTTHVINRQNGKSISVSKRCAEPAECTSDMVGCTIVNGVQKCVTCCNYPYCNEQVPSNHSSALMLSMFTGSSSSLHTGAPLSSLSRTLMLGVVTVFLCAKVRLR